MAIGYYNFGNIQQGNQQIANSMAGLGQQIAGAIETHAATQSAQAMLPMLQQQYQNGMQKIADGDPNGLSDIYGASVIASQNPLLAPMAGKAVTMAQSANINAQHMARTQAYLQGRMGSLYGQYGSGLMNAPAGMNPNWAGKQATIKNPTVTDLKHANDMDKDLADKAEQSLRLGDQDGYDQYMNQRISLRNQFPNITLPTLSGASTSFDTASQLSALQKELKAENAKGKGNFFKSGTDQNKVNALKQQMQQLQSAGGGNQLPAVQGGSNIGNSIIQLPTGKKIKASDYQQAVDQLLANPDTKDIFDTHFGKGAADKILKDAQSSIDTSGGQQVAENGPEAADEAEAVAGGEEPSSNPEDTMIA
jgi:hypothetical protein